MTVMNLVQTVSLLTILMYLYENYYNGSYFYNNPAVHYYEEHGSYMNALVTLCKLIFSLDISQSKASFTAAYVT